MAERETHTIFHFQRDTVYILKRILGQGFGFIDMNKVLKIVGFYFLGLICLGLYFYIDNSKELTVFLQKADRVKVDWGFAFYAIVGLLKLTSLIAGLAIPIILTFILIRQKNK